jgi:DNA gyrase subunit A
MIRHAYETGRATLVVQAKADIQDIGGGKSEIIITELPYQVQKNTILERVAASKEKFAGLTDARDESDYKGMRVVFEVARGADPREVLERLLTFTQMRSSLSYNAMALVRDENNVTYAQLQSR